MRSSLNKKVVQISSLLTLVFLFSFQEKEAITITWKDLSHVKYKNKYSSQNKNFYIKAYPSEKILKLNNKEVRIQGNITPLDTYGEQFLLSRKDKYPHSCGFPNVKLHEVIDLQLKNRPANFNLHDTLTFQGKLKVSNKKDLDLLYTLENAELVR